MAYSKIILNGETLMDVTSDTVDAGNLLSGKTATKNSGAKVTGNIATKSSSDLTVSGATVTAPAGYYSTTASKAVATTTHPNPTATIASATGVVTASHTQGTGYVTGGTTTGTLNLTTQAAQTINTSTADQTIASNRWLTGTQTIKSVTTTNLTAANIVSGVVVKVGDANNASRIAQITGTYAPTVSSLTVTPTETSQTFNATGVYGYKPVTVNAISSTYVGTGVAKKSSNDTTFASATGTFTAPIGYYSAAATKTITTQAAQTIYPSTADQTITSYRWLTGTQTIKSVTTSNLTAANIAEGIVVKVGDANNASRITQVTGTHIGGTQRTFTITGTGNSTTCYIQHNNIKYYSAGSFLFKSGDIANLYVYGNNTTMKYASVVINGTSVHGAYSTYSSAYTLPDCNITANLLTNSDDRGLLMNYSTINISQNGGYDVCDYGWASVSVTGSPEWYSLFATSLRSNVKYAEDYSFPSLITDIPNYLFAGMNLQGSGWDFPNVSGFVGSSAFLSCFGAYADADITISNCTSIGQYAFANCNRLVSINCPKCMYMNSYCFMGAGIKSIDCPSCRWVYGFAFASCGSLVSANFPSCESIGSSAFISCYNLTTINFPNCDVMYYDTFAYCSKLTEAYFPSCLSMQGGNFKNCISLVSANFSVCTSMGSSTFLNCSALTTVNLPQLSVISFTAFQNCTALTTVNFPVCTSIGTSAFYGCTHLYSISFPLCNSISTAAFYNCYSLKEAVFPSCSIIYDKAFQYCSALTTASFPVCTVISANAFRYCSALTTVSFPSCTQVLNGAFGNCPALTTINLPACTIISDYAFSSCINLRTISLPNCSTISNNAFAYCYNLLSLYLLGSSFVSLLDYRAFNSTPISTYTTSTGGVYGSIYVPASLYNSYITTGAWARYSSRFVSV